MRIDPIEPPREFGVGTRGGTLRHVADVRRCFEREGLTRDPRLAGSMEVAVTVLPTGVVERVAITAQAMRGIGGREVAVCLTTAIRNWRFGRGPYAVETIVFPFDFAPDAGGTPRTAARSGT